MGRRRRSDHHGFNLGVLDDLVGIGSRRAEGAVLEDSDSRRPKRVGGHHGLDFAVVLQLAESVSMDLADHPASDHPDSQWISRHVISLFDASFLGCLARASIGLGTR